MKQETRANKLNELLGITTKVEEVKVRSTGKIVEISEEEIQNFRAAQGLIYFLKAPALFQAKACKHCGERYLVSRLYVAYCSYTCIRKSLSEQGLEWRKGHDLEQLAIDPQVYDGNEPLWIRDPLLGQLEKIFYEVKALKDSGSLSKGVLTVHEVEPISSIPEGAASLLPSYSTATQTSSGTSGGSSTSRSKSRKRGITFKP